MSLKPKIEAIIYAAETPITLDQIVALLKDSATEGADLKSEARAAIEELVAIILPRPTASNCARSPADTACPPSPSSTTWCVRSPKA